MTYPPPPEPAVTPIPPKFRDRMAELDAVVAEDIDAPLPSHVPPPYSRTLPPTFEERMAEIDATVKRDDMREAWIER
jgi:hypothetical protein